MTLILKPRINTNCLNGGYEDMEVMIKLENVDYTDEQTIKNCLEQTEDIDYEIIEEDGFDGVSVLIAIISSGTLSALITVMGKIYSAKIKSINEQQYTVKISKDGVEVKAPTLDETRRLLKDAVNYKEILDGENTNE